VADRFSDAVPGPRGTAGYSEGEQLQNTAAYRFWERHRACDRFEIWVTKCHTPQERMAMRCTIHSAEHDQLQDDLGRALYEKARYWAPWRRT
jgi:hypothetical protein